MMFFLELKNVNIQTQTVVRMLQKLLQSSELRYSGNSKNSFWSFNTFGKEHYLVNGCEFLHVVCEKFQLPNSEGSKDAPRNFSGHLILDKVQENPKTHSAVKFGKEHFLV